MPGGRGVRVCVVRERYIPARPAGRVGRGTGGRHRRRAVPAVVSGPGPCRPGAGRAGERGCVRWWSWSLSSVKLLRPADILVVLGQRGGRFGGVGESVLVTRQEVFDLFEAQEVVLVGYPTGGIEAAGGIAFAELQQSQADAIGLLGVGAARQLLADPGLHVRAELPGPACEPFGRPALLCAVEFGHVGRLGGEAVAVAAPAGCDAPDSNTMPPWRISTIATRGDWINP